MTKPSSGGLPHSKLLLHFQNSQREFASFLSWNPLSSLLHCIQSTSPWRPQRNWQLKDQKTNDTSGNLTYTERTWWMERKDSLHQASITTKGKSLLVNSASKNSNFKRWYHKYQKKQMLRTEADRTFKHTSFDAAPMMSHKAELYHRCHLRQTSLQCSTTGRRSLLHRGSPELFRILMQMGSLQVFLDWNRKSQLWTSNLRNCKHSASAHLGLEAHWGDYFRRRAHSH